MSNKREQGAVLIVALIMLLIMTLIGVSSMQGSTFQERMTANAKDKFTSQLAAESALRAGEQFLSTQDVSTLANVSDLVNNQDAMYSFRAINASNPAIAIVIDVEDDTAWNNGNSVETSAVSLGLSQSPRYLIEFLGTDIPGENDAATEIYDSPDEKKPRYFRVIAIGWGKDENVFSVLESTYMSPP